MDLFAKRNPEKSYRTQQIKTQVAKLLELDEDATVMVTELNCQDDDCPEVETVIAIFQLNQAKIQITLHSSMEELTDSEVEQACRDIQRKSLPSEETAVTLERHT